MKHSMVGWMKVFVLVACVAAGALRGQTSRPAEPPGAGGAAGREGGVRMLEEPARRVLRLENGLTVLLQQNKTAPVVAARVYVKAGSLTEQEFMGCGISHVLEHLVAGATSERHQEAENQQLLRVLGGDSNAFTTFDETCYFITTTAEKWPTALDLLADWTTAADFTPEQFAREYQVVQRELETGEAEAAPTFYQAVYANRYRVHPAKHPVIGYRAAFHKLTWQNCRDYYQRMYVPDNMVVSIAGDIDLGQAEKLVREKFGKVERKKVPAIALPAEPAVTAPRTAIAHGDVPDARVVWAFPTVDLYSPDLYALDVLSTILGDGESSVLVQKLRDEKALVTSIGAMSDTPRFAAGSLDFSAQLKPTDIPQAQAALLAELERVCRDGVSKEQVARAQTQLSASLVYGNQTAEQQAGRNAEDFLATGNLDFSKLYIERIKQVTPETVQAAAKKYIRREALLTTVLLPRGVPDRIVGAGAVAEVAGVQGAVKKMTLGNGLTVLIRQNTAAPLVSMQLYVMGGLLAEDDTNNGIGNALMALMARETTTRSPEQIAEFVDGTGGNLSTVSGNNTFAVQAEALKEHAARTFEVFADVALHPALSDAELNRLRPRLLAAIARSTEDWTGEGMQLLRKSFFEKSPYKRLPAGLPEVVGKLTAVEVRKHYENVFLDPAKAVLAIYGDVDVDEATRWAQKFAEMPAHSPKLADASVDAPPRTVRQPTHKESAAVFIGYGPGMVVTSEDRYAMTVLQTLLGGYNSPGGAILHETLRGKGLVYVVQAGNFAGPAPGMFMIYALGQPGKTEEIVATISQIVAEARAGRFRDPSDPADADIDKLSAARIQTAKNQAITGEQLRDQTIAEATSAEALDQLLGLGYDARAKLADNIRKVTRDDLKRVAGKYLQNPVVAICVPEEAAAPTTTKERR